MAITVDIDLGYEFTVKASAKAGKKLQKLIDVYNKDDFAQTLTLAQELLGLEEANEYDKSLAAQLADPGRLVIPVGETTWNQTLWLIEKRQGRLHVEALAEVRFVPLLASSRAAEAADPALAEIRQALSDAFRARW